MNRFQTVPHIGKGPAYNDTHCVFHVGITHFIDDIGRYDRFTHEASPESGLLRLMEMRTVTPGRKE